MKIYKYDEYNNEYTAKIGEIDFCIDHEPSDIEESYTIELSKAYDEKIMKIMNFILTNEDFEYAFEQDNMTEEELIESLGTPIIQIINENEGTLTYWNQSLDDEHIILFEFIGKFDELLNLSIDG